MLLSTEETQRQEWFSLGAWGALSALLKRQYVNWVLEDKVWLQLVMNLANCPWHLKSSFVRQLWTVLFKEAPYNVLLRIELSA